MTKNKCFYCGRDTDLVFDEMDMVYLCRECRDAEVEKCMNGSKS